MAYSRNLGLYCLSLFLVGAGSTGMVRGEDAPKAEPFRLGVEQSGYAQTQSYPSYPTYPAYPTYAVPPPAKPMSAGVTKSPTKAINAGVQQNVQNVPKRPPLQAQAAAPGVLPQQFLGVWQVMGSRTKVEAAGDFQAQASSAFATTTSNTWQIQGNPQSGYGLTTDQGVSTQIGVDKATSQVAYLRYQHPIRNTMAQEAIVMQLSPDGMQFTGLERITIVKQGEPPRAVVTYQLIGRRQR